MVDAPLLDATVPAVGEAARQVASGRSQGAARWWLGWISLAAFLAFGLDSILVLGGIATSAFDVPVEGWVQSVNWGPMADLMRLTNASGGWGQVVLGAVAILGMLAWERRAGFLMALGCVGSVIDSVLKVSVARHRPSADLVQVLGPSAGYSYPSGHAVFFTWFAFMIAAAVSPHVRSSRRAALWAVAGFLIVVACLGRVWAGVHWPSDVVGGFLLGLGWSAFVLWLPERWLPAPAWHWVRERFHRS